VNLFKKYKKKISNIIILVFIIFIISIRLTRKKSNEKEAQNLLKYFEICNNGLLINKMKVRKNKNPLVSIIISTYNRENTILRLLRSIQNQNFKNMEILFIDDFSTDFTLNKIKELQKNEDRILLIKNKRNKGTLISRNIGIMKSKGDYILIPDSDDIFSKDIIKNCYKISKKYNIEIIRYNAYENNSNFQNQLISKLPKNKIIYQPELSTFMFYGFGTLQITDFTLWNKFMKREALIRALNNIDLFYLNQYMIIKEDQMINYAIYRNSKSLYILENFGYYYIFNKRTSSYIHVDKKERIRFTFLYINFIIENSKNTKKEKDMALFIYRRYNKNENILKSIDINCNLYKKVIYFFLNYSYITLKEKKEFQNTMKLKKENKLYNITIQKY